MPALDPAALERLRALDPEGDKGLVIAVFEAFLADAPAALASLSPLAETPLAERARAAHALCSAASNVGAETLAEACRSLEERARAGERALEAPLRALCEELEGVCAELERHCEARAGARG